MKKYLIIVLLSLSLFSCTDDIIIDVQEGPKLVGVSGYITNEKFMIELEKLCIKLKEAIQQQDLNKLNLNE